MCCEVSGKDRLGNLEAADAPAMLWCIIRSRNDRLASWLELIQVDKFRQRMESGNNAVHEYCVTKTGKAKWLEQIYRVEKEPFLWPQSIKNTSCQTEEVGRPLLLIMFQSFV
jgi:hypothetical protein